MSEQAQKSCLRRKLEREVEYQQSCAKLFENLASDYRKQRKYKKMHYAKGAARNLRESVKRLEATLEGIELSYEGIS